MIQTVCSNLTKRLQHLYCILPRTAVRSTLSRFVSVCFPMHGLFSHSPYSLQVTAVRSVAIHSFHSTTIASSLHSCHGKSASMLHRVSSWPTTIQRLQSRSSSAAPDVFPKRVTRRQKKKDAVHQSQTSYKVTAFATAEEYRLESVAAEAPKYGYVVVQLPEDALDAVYLEAINNDNAEMRRIFLFSEGSVVFWNLSESEQRQWLDVISRHQDGSYDVDIVQEEQEILDYSYSDGDSRLVSGDIELCRSDTAAQQLNMFAFSNALSSSVKLAVWEALLAQYVDSIEWVLEDLKEGKKIRISEPDVLKKAGHLFTLSHLINLSSDLLDTPDFYWDREDLEILYNKTCNYLNIARRTKVMNEKLHQCVGLVELLRDHLKDKHHTRLELMIIILIMIEVLYATFHMVEKYYFVRNENTDSFLE